MRIAGIVAEYNPFHKGHLYQIQTLREMGYEGIVVAMSGNFVQRADSALTDKYLRAEAAVRCGADLIFELPLPYAVASSEDFARGGIRILTATGAVDTVCCGCESSQEQIQEQYQALCRAESAGVIRKQMQNGLSYPAACKAAITTEGTDWSGTPNDVLALGYRKALDRIAPQIPLICVKRKGSFHGNGEDGYESAQSIRRRFTAGEDVSDALPKACYDIIKNAPQAQLHYLERAILAFYRTANPERLKEYYGMREGLERRIFKYADAKNLETLFDAVKTKRYPHSAVRRAVLCGYLGIPSQLPEISYLRVLAFNQRGQKILRTMKHTASLPVCSVLTPQMRRDPVFSPLVETQLRGDEIFTMTLPCPGKRLRDLTECARKISLEQEKF